MEEQDEIRDLVEKAKKLDREAFGKIYDIYYKSVYKYIYFKIGDLNEAEDLAAQTFAGALKSIDNFTWRGSTFASWLFRIAGNRVVDYYRKRGRSKIEPLDKASDVSSGEDPTITVLNHLDYEATQAAISKLPYMQQQVVILKFINDLSNKEIASTVGKSEGAVKSLQFRAIRKLHELLGGVR